MNKMSAFSPRFTELDSYLFGHSTHYELYKKMGAHPDIVDGTEGVWFTVWAPNAKAVYVVGDFNGWYNEADPMEKVAEIRARVKSMAHKRVPPARPGKTY